MTTNGKTFPVLARVFSRSCAKRSSSPATSPPRTTRFDIFSPPSGDSDVISQVDRLSSNETKIAPRSVRIAVGASGRSATVCMVASREWVVATSLCQSAGRYLPPHGILNSAVNRLPVFMVDHPSRHRIHLNHLSQKPGPPLLLVVPSFRTASLLSLSAGTSSWLCLRRAGIQNACRRPRHHRP